MSAVIFSRQLAYKLKGRLSTVSSLILSIPRTSGNCPRLSRCLTTPQSAMTTTDSPVLNVEKAKKERFVPVTRHTLIRHLMERENFLSDDEKKAFEDFAISLDHAIHNRYHGILDELKALFDPINPDKETAAVRSVTKKDRLDTEFWLLQRLEDVLERANFHEVTKGEVRAALGQHDSKEGVRVSVDTGKYDVLRFWALGKETPRASPTWFRNLYSRLRGEARATPSEFYKRVVVAIRLKRDDKLILKSFKEVQVSSLEMLLPDGQISLRTSDRGILAVSGGLAIAGAVAKLVTYLAGYHVDWTLLVTVVTGAMAAQAWTMHKNRRSAYVAAHSRLLYFRNIANNRGLLALLVDRAQDESMKEALLTYAFLLTNRPDYSGLATSTPVDVGWMPEPRLERVISDWVNETFNVRVDYNCAESVKLLEHFGILNQSGERLEVLPMHAAVKNLPHKTHSLVARAMDSDLAEGYDHDILRETDEEYRESEKKKRLFGWF